MPGAWPERARPTSREWRAAGKPTSEDEWLHRVAAIPEIGPPGESLWRSLGRPDRARFEELREHARQYRRSALGGPAPFVPTEPTLGDAVLGTLAEVPATAASAARAVARPVSRIARETMEAVPPPAPTPPWSLEETRRRFAAERETPDPSRTSRPGR